MAFRQLYGPSYDARDSDRRFTVEHQSTWPAEKGWIIEMYDACRVYVNEAQLRGLRDQITQALGESPQSTSNIEAIQSLASTIRQTADQIVEVVSMPPIAVESEK